MWINGRKGTIDGEQECGDWVGFWENVVAGW
jgi:hypothetical protein